jgi:hypothetical protein
VSSDDEADGMSYYTHHTNMDGPHYVWTHVQCQHSAGGKEKNTNININVTSKKNSLKGMYNYVNNYYMIRNMFFTEYQYISRN